LKLLAALLVLALLVSDGAAWGHAASPCRWVHGRLTFGNGSPWVRIWPHGTHRLLGVVDREGNPEGDRLVPDAVAAPWLGNHDLDVWGDFRVCPIEPDRAGHMRRVYMIAARRFIGLSPKGDTH